MVGDNAVKLEIALYHAWTTRVFFKIPDVLKPTKKCLVFSRAKRAHEMIQLRTLRTVILDLEITHLHRSMNVWPFSTELAWHELFFSLYSISFLSLIWGLRSRHPQCDSFCVANWQTVVSVGNIKHARFSVQSWGQLMIFCQWQFVVMAGLDTNWLACRVEWSWSRPACIPKRNVFERLVRVAKKKIGNTNPLHLSCKNLEKTWRLSSSLR